MGNQYFHLKHFVYVQHRKKNYFLFNISDASHHLKRIFSDGVNVSCDETKCILKGAATEGFLAEI